MQSFMNVMDWVMVYDRYIPFRLFTYVIGVILKRNVTEVGQI